jgi:hypothetical protein
MSQEVASFPLSKRFLEREYKIKSSKNPGRGHYSQAIELILKQIVLSKDMETTEQRDVRR